MGHSIVPNVILPKPAVSVNIAKPTKQQSQPKININGNHGVRPRSPLQLNGGLILGMHIQGWGGGSMQQARVQDMCPSSRHWSGIYRHNDMVVCC